jgi:hypothetical protein
MIRAPSCDFWRVGLVPAPIEALVEPGALESLRDRIAWLHDPDHWSYLADPFALRRGGDLHVFVEAFDYRTKHAVIEHHRYGPGMICKGRQVALAGTAHLSYPYLIEEAGEVFMVPESQLNGEITLYRAHDFPLGWKRELTLLSNTRGADATLVRHQGLWWMFFSVVGPDARDQRELHAAHAPNLTGPWTLHPQNPIIDDRSGARPGGSPFTLADGSLILPVQDCSQTYGGGIRFLRFETLAPTHIVAHHEPTRLTGDLVSDSHRHGLHTLSSCGDMTLIDVKRTEQRWSRHTLNLIRHAKRIFRQ